MGITAVTSVVNSNGPALAQVQGGSNITNTNATNIDTFRAKGQISSLASDTSLEDLLTHQKCGFLVEIGSLA